MKLNNNMLLFILITILSLCTLITSSKTRVFTSSKRQFNLRTSSDLIIFPEDSHQNQNNDKLESFLHQTIELRNVSDFLKAFGVKEDVDEVGIFGRKKDSYAEQATCQPELRTIELPSNEPDSLFFPVCVRLPRCGGCCGLSHVLECVPTKVSLRELKRARVRVKRSTNGRSSAEASQISIKVEIHDECKCKCKVKEDDCDDNLHRYKPELCKCVCINQDKELACEKESSNKIWDGKSCECKCKNTKLCSTGLVFSHHKCGCVQIEK